MNTWSASGNFLTQFPTRTYKTALLLRVEAVLLSLKQSYNVTMLTLISNLVNKPVVTMDQAEPLGLLRDPIIDPTNGKLIAFFFGHGFLHMQQSVLAADDIASYDDNRIVVHRDDVARVVDEEPKIREILSQRVPVLGANVLTESGKKLGRANDLLLDTELSMIVKYYVHGMLSDRIIPAEHVVTIDKRGIIVDDIAEVTAGAAAELS